MPTPPLPDADYQEAVDAYAAACQQGYKDNGVPSAQQVAAQTLEMEEDKYRRRLRRARKKGFIPFQPVDEETREPKVPDYPADEPIEKVRERMKAASKRNWERYKASQWFEIEMPDDKPFALNFWGDPHLGVNTNWDLLERDIEICSTTEGLYNVNIGDTVDNWPLMGRLSKLWAEHDISLDTEVRLVRWFFEESGLKWLVWLLGNHDVWNNAGRLWREIVDYKVRVHEAEAKFVMVCPSGVRFPIWARHNFKGYSQYNTLHAVMRALREKAPLNQTAWPILGIQGHLHNWAIHEEESSHKEYIWTAARCRGYKWADDHQVDLGHEPQQYGASITYVCNPQAGNAAQMTTIWKDVEEAAWYLTQLRGRYK